MRRLLTIFMIFALIFTVNPMVQAEASTQSVDMEAICKAVAGAELSIQDGIVIAVKDVTLETDIPARFLLNTEGTGLGKDHFSEVTYFVPNESSTADDIIGSLRNIGTVGNWSESDSGFDTSVSVYGSLTIAYTVTANSAGAKYVRINSCSGYYTLYEDFVTVSNQHVKVGCSGNPYTNQVMDRYPTSSSWSYSTPSSWGAVRTIEGLVGARYGMTVNWPSTSNSWNFELEKMLVGNSLSW